ncbi:hypothetical protein, partial [Candidatus Hodarchaeum mangrovi]
IIIGVVVGILVALLYVQIDKRYGSYYTQKSDKVKIFLGFLSSIILVILGFGVVYLTTFLFGSALVTDLWNNSDLGVYPGIFGGIIVGKVFEDQYINFKIYGRQPVSLLIRIIIGFTSVVLLYFFTDKVSGLFENSQSIVPWVSTLVDYCSYFILAFTLALIIPWLFTKIESVFLKGK